MIRLLNAREVTYPVAWEKLQRRSWTLGHGVRQWGRRYYGSTWNALLPHWDEWRMAREVDELDPDVVHFLWGEFASPRRPDLFRRKRRAVVGTFHCSARRQPAVLQGFKCFHSFDAISVVSVSQIPFFLEHDVPRERIRYLPLGIDTDVFKPAAEFARLPGPLRMALVGSTERDHAFAADVMKRIDPEAAHLSVCTAKDYHSAYQGIPSVQLLPFLSDDELIRLYQTVDLLFMPMLDCTANDAILEAMACGTPVMVNRVGGVAEYVDPLCNWVFDEKNAGAWADALRQLSREKERAWSRRAEVRRAVERFRWTSVVEQYRAFYKDAARVP